MTTWTLSGIVLDTGDAITPRSGPAAGTLSAQRRLATEVCRLANDAADLRIGVALVARVGDRALLCCFDSTVRISPSAFVTAFSALATSSQTPKLQP